MPPEIYGPAGALVALVFVLLALVRGDLVPGFIYRASVAREEKSSEQAVKNAEALTVLAKAAANGNGKSSVRYRSGDDTESRRG